MEIKTEIMITLPPMLAAALGITEDTLFETYFDGNCLRVRTLDEEEVESAILMKKLTNFCNVHALRKMILLLLKQE